MCSVCKVAEGNNLAATRQSSHTLGESRKLAQESTLGDSAVPTIHGTEQDCGPYVCRPYAPKRTTEKGAVSARPPTWIFQNREEAMASASQIQFPVVVKAPPPALSVRAAPCVPGRLAETAWRMLSLTRIPWRRSGTLRGAYVSALR